MHSSSAPLPGDQLLAELGRSLDGAQARIVYLETLINNPKTDSFLEAVRIEAAHQSERWGSDHDAGKEPHDWFWLIGYLAGKALASTMRGETQKALHHTISTAAVCANWFRSISGTPTEMRPGIAEPISNAPTTDG